MNNQSISIFFPCYNDSGTIAAMVLNSFSTLKELNITDYEVIVVDDASKDTSVSILEELKKNHPKLKIIKHEQNKGYGGALQSGINNSCKELIFYTDGDAQYDVKELKKLYEKFLQTNADLINGYKIERHDPLHRILIGKIYNFVVRKMFAVKIKDVDCDFRLMKKEIFKKIKLTKQSGVICLEMIKKIEKANFKTAEVPVHHYFRTHGKSQFFNFKRVFRVGCGLFSLWLELVLSKK